MKRQEVKLKQLQKIFSDSLIINSFLTVKTLRCILSETHKTQKIFSN